MKTKVKNVRYHNFPLLQVSVSESNKTSKYELCNDMTRHVEKNYPLVAFQKNLYLKSHEDYQECKQVRMDLEFIMEGYMSGRR